jgi:hypothetical protein
MSFDNRAAIYCSDVFGTSGENSSFCFDCATRGVVMVWQRGPFLEWSSLLLELSKTFGYASWELGDRLVFDKALISSLLRKTGRKK